MATNISREMVACVVRIKLNESLNSAVRYINSIEETYDLSYELCLDSMELVDFAVKLEKVFGIKIPSQDFERMHTVGQFIDYIYEAVQNKEKEIPVQTYKENPQTPKKKKEFSFFTRWLATIKNKKEKQLTLQEIKKSDKSYNELLVLQYLLFQTVNRDSLNSFIKSTFGSEIPKAKLENVSSIESLFSLVKQYEGKHK